ncbi:MAG TPA: nucleotidyltransferase [Phycisphaerales bacterium]|nr:nucleotidyltransferase [Phycisphaerales bacterium]HCD35041.1 nucleotidyltransferase [Phycisphaerales bacterium]|tara:strand:- start:451 stop:711 length:261 start_codon:yes stop_codon:yes gene_type:complete
MFAFVIFVKTLSLLGSTLHGNDTPDSDVDLLVEFQQGQKVGNFRLTELQLALEDLIGRKVDLRTANDLSKYSRQQVLEEAMVIYER